MNAIEQAKRAAQLISGSRLIEHTNGSAAVDFKVSQGGKQRSARFDFVPGNSPVGDKYSYLLPGDLDIEIERFGIASS